MLDGHIARGARLTVGAIEIAVADAGRYGVLEVDADSRVLAFREKPETPPEAPWSPGRCLASMGIYIFDRELRGAAARRRSRLEHDFGRTSCRGWWARASGSTHLFWDENKKESQYWRDADADAYFGRRWTWCASIPCSTSTIRVAAHLPAAAPGRSCSTGGGAASPRVIVSTGCIVPAARCGARSCASACASTVPPDRGLDPANAT